jgi:hypothetical protein
MPVERASADAVKKHLQGIVLGEIRRYEIARLVSAAILAVPA